MLDQKMIANIRDSGMVQGADKVEKRAKLLQQELGFRVADKAEYALMASCFLPSVVPQGMKALGNLLQHFEVDYTLLRKEYCCGELFFRQALNDKSDEELTQAHVLAREFLDNNLRQVRELGASKIVTFCVGCDSVYARLKGVIPHEILWYPTLLAQLFRGGKLELQADYYAGCHYYSRRLSPTLPDLDSPLRILKQIEGLQLNHLNHELCCTRPRQAQSLAASVENKTVITVCGGCAMSLQETLKNRDDCRVVMLPQVVWAAVSGHEL